MTDELARKVTHLSSDDNKMLLLNGRYYCWLTTDSKQLSALEHCIYFSCFQKEENSPTVTQYTYCYILDTCLEKGHYASQFAKLYHSVHSDLSSAHAFSLMLLLDNAIVSVTDIEIVDKSCLLKKLIDLNARLKTLKKEGRK